MLILVTTQTEAALRGRCKHGGCSKVLFTGTSTPACRKQLGFFFSHHFVTEILSIILNVKYMWLLTFTLTCLYFSFRKNNPRFLTVLPKYQKTTLVQKQEAALR